MKRLDKCLKIANSLRPRHNILDIGCADGEFLYQLEQVFKTAGYGIDRVRNGFDIDSKSLPFEDCSFDFIFAGNMVDILPNPDKLLLEIRRLLKFEGIALLTFPCLDWWANKIAILLGYQPYGDRPSRDYNVGKLFIKPHKFSLTNSGYFHYFTRRAFKQLAQIYGFKVKFYTLPLQRFSIVTLEVE